VKPIIRVENLSKQYTIGTRQATYGTLRDSLTGWLRNPFRRNGASEDNTIWALRDVSFDVMPGEVLGIIGRNGAGKSTLLKILSRIVEPTTGKVDLYGRVGSLLEVGTGFHGELSGRENIYLNGAILGMKRTEIDRKFDEIVDFAEIEKFIDTPVKHYSSGMYMRLAFAVAAHLEPEILIVDEVLAVGDAEFQNKCIGKMEDISRHGRTILFVSHNLIAIQNLCTRVLYLEHGQVIDSGGAKTIVSSYINRNVVGLYERVWESPMEAPGNDQVRLYSARVLAMGGGPLQGIDVNTPLQIEFDYWNYVESARLNLCLIVKTSEGFCAFNTVSPAEVMSVGLIKGRCHLPGKFLNDGVYSMDLCIVRDGVKVIYVYNQILAIAVKDEKREIQWHGKWIGAVRPRLHWDHFVLTKVPAACPKDH
jgi:lipopolysaccharide transport system ATP-binding protein